MAGRHNYNHKPTLSGDDSDIIWPFLLNLYHRITTNAGIDIIHKVLPHIGLARLYIIRMVILYLSIYFKKVYYLQSNVTCNTLYSVTRNDIIMVYVMTLSVTDHHSCCFTAMYWIFTSYWSLDFYLHDVFQMGFRDSASLSEIWESIVVIDASK